MRAPSMSTISNVKVFHLSFSPVCGICPRLVEDQAAEGVVEVVRVDVLQPVADQKIVKRALPVDQAAAVLPVNDVRLLPLFGNRAYQRFEDVVQGDDALRHAEFVADDAVADLLAAELFQRGVHLGLLVEEFCRTQYGCDVEILLSDVREEVLEVYHAGQPVEVAAGGGVERVGFPADQARGSLRASWRGLSMRFRCGAS